MCIQVVERYKLCGCLFRKHQVDACSNYRRRGHVGQIREVKVGYTCPQHASSSVYRPSGTRARRQAPENYQSDIPWAANRRELLVSAQTEDPQYASSSVYRPSSTRVRRRALEIHQTDVPWAANRSESFVSAQTEDPYQRVTDRSDSGPAVGSDESIFQSWSFANDLEDADTDAPTPYIRGLSPRIDIVDPDQQTFAFPGPDPGGSHHGQSEVQTPSTSTASPGQFDTRHAPSPGENMCPHQFSHSAGACPRECCWVVEQTIEKGDTATDINKRQLSHLLRDSLVFAFANLSQRIWPIAITQSNDPCMGTNSHTITGSIELDTLQSDRSCEGSTSRAPQQPTAILDNLQDTDSPFTAMSHTRTPEKRPSIPPCYLLIFLGFITVIGSLVPGLWRARSRNDLSGGFSLAQYILGVGIFIVGSMVAIHSKSCECWKTHSEVGQVVGASH